MYNKSGGLVRDQYVSGTPEGNGVQLRFKRALLLSSIGRRKADRALVAILVILLTEVLPVYMPVVPRLTTLLLDLIDFAFVKPVR